VSSSFQLLVFPEAVLFALVAGHAKLNTPAAWNPQPSKAAPCGGAAQLTDTVTSWEIGGRSTVAWQVVAGDGVGAVSAIIDPTGGTTFTGTPISLGTASVVGPATFTFTVPDTTCTGTSSDPTKGPICTVQIKSDSGWVACATVRVSGTFVPPPPKGVNCQVVEGLQYCTEQNGVNVEVAPGSVPANTDATVRETFLTTLYNPNVFSAPNTTRCATAYKNYLCKNAFPYCGQEAACQPACYDAIGICKITDSHRGLYDCTQGVVKCDDPGSDAVRAAFGFALLLVSLFFAL